MPEEANRNPVHSSIFLNLMAHTDRMRAAVPIAQAINDPNTSPVTRRATAGITTPKHPVTNSIQTAIDARALNTGGIFSLLSGFTLPFI
jgi:hypothetical protein